MARAREAKELIGTFERDRFASLALAAAVLLNLATAPLFILVAVPRGYYSEAPGAYLFFLCVSIAHIAAANAARGKRYLWAVLASWQFFFLLLTYQFGAWLVAKFLLLAGYALLAGALAPWPTGALLSLSAVLGGSIVHLAVLRSAGGLGVDSVIDLAVAATAATAIAALACAASGYRGRMVKYGTETRSLKAMAESLAQAQLGYLELAKSASERSSAEERNRLSAELHDSIGYAFTNLKMILEAGKDLVESDPARLRDLLDTGLEQVRQGMRETRTTLYLLRERRDAPLFFGAVQRLVDVFRKTTGIQVQVDYANFPQDCDPEVKSAFYHLIQEGLVNAFNHGKASRVNISFRVDGENMRVAIRDNGAGADHVVEGIGIRGMRERLGKLGGTLVLDSLLDGFLIVAEVPVNG